MSGFPTEWGMRITARLPENFTSSYPGQTWRPSSAAILRGYLPGYCVLTVYDSGTVENPASLSRSNAKQRRRTQTFFNEISPTPTLIALTAKSRPSLALSKKG